jgi:ATP-binding cassette subfamily C protein CydD
MAADDTERFRSEPVRKWVREQTRLGVAAARPAILLGVVGTMLAIGQAFCVALALHAALLSAQPEKSLWPLGGFAVLALLRALTGFLAEQAAFAAGATGRRRLRSEVLTGLLHAAPSALQKIHSGDLAATITDRIEALDGLFSRWLPAAALAVAGPGLVLLAALWADPFAALTLLLTGLAVPLGMAVAGLGAAAAARGQFRAMARLQARFLDRVRGIATIVMHGRAEDEARALGLAADELRRRTMRVLRVAFLSGAVLDLAAAAALVALALHYGFSIAAGTLAAPERALFAFLLVPEFFGPLRAFSLAYQDRLHATGAADALADLPPAPPPAPAKTIRNIAAHGVTVAFEDVHLTWDASRGPALDGLSFRLPAGETLLLVGPSGAGKSTVMEILLGFVRPDAGRVTINGADIADIVPQALSRLTAWVGQRPVLFAGSIRDNIRFARPEASDAEVEQAANQARVGEFSDSLPRGLDTILGEGGYGLSGGQAQRVAIARAFLKDSPLLLLDEPTAHLDPATEADVLDSLRRLAVGRTVILASHAAAVHAFSGRRLDLRDGRAVAEQGAA